MDQVPSSPTGYGCALSSRIAGSDKASLLLYHTKTGHRNLLHNDKRSPYFLNNLRMFLAYQNFLDPNLPPAQSLPGRRQQWRYYHMVLRHFLMVWKLFLVFFFRSFLTSWWVLLKPQSHRRHTPPDVVVNDLMVRWRHDYDELFGVTHCALD